MATLKLKKPPSSGGKTSDAPHSGRAPLRGTANRPRPTLAEAQAERAARPASPSRDPSRGSSRDLPPPRERGPRNDEGRTGRPPRRGEEAARFERPSRGPSDPRSAPRSNDTRRPPPLNTTARPRPNPVSEPHRAHGEPAPQGVRLSKRLTEMGLASRREADEWIEAGWVRVNGRAAVLGQRVGPDDQIDINDSARTQQAQKVTVLLHKPIGYVSGQAEDGHEPAVVLVTPANRWAGDTSSLRLPPQWRGLAPAGRLDIDSTGLLVFTQDGRVAKRLIGENSDVEKEYLVRVEPLPTLREDAIQLLQHGLELDGVMLRPARVSWQNEEQLRIVLREGRKRQIRRMCELVGYKVVGLRRIRIGSVVLGPLPPGQWRFLRWDEKF